MVIDRVKGECGIYLHQQAKASRFPDQDCFRIKKFGKMGNSMMYARFTTHIALSQTGQTASHVLGAEVSEIR